MLCLSNIMLQRKIKDFKKRIQTILNEVRFYKFGMLIFRGNTIGTGFLMLVSAKGTAQ